MHEFPYFREKIVEMKHIFVILEPSSRLLYVVFFIHLQKILPFKISAIETKIIIYLLAD
jgi:hypothetical protein